MSDLLTHLRVSNAVTASMLEEAQALSAQAHAPFDASLIEVSKMTEEPLLLHLQQCTGLPVVTTPKLATVPEEVLGLVPAEVAQQFGIIPLSLEGNTLHVAVQTPLTDEAAYRLRFFMAYDLQPHITHSARMAEALNRYYGIPLEPWSRRVLALLDDDTSAPPTPVKKTHVLRPRRARAVSVLREKREEIFRDFISYTQQYASYVALYQLRGAEALRILQSDDEPPLDLPSQISLEHNKPWAEAFENSVVKLLDSSALRDSSEDAPLSPQCAALVPLRLRHRIIVMVYLMFRDYDSREQTLGSILSVMPHVEHALIELIMQTKNSQTAHIYNLPQAEAAAVDITRDLLSVLGVPRHAPAPPTRKALLRGTG